MTKNTVSNRYHGHDIVWRAGDEEWDLTTPPPADSPDDAEHELLGTFNHSVDAILAAEMRSHMLGIIETAASPDYAVERIGAICEVIGKILQDLAVGLSVNPAEVKQ